VSINEEPVRFIGSLEANRATSYDSQLLIVNVADAVASRCSESSSRACLLPSGLIVIVLLVQTHGRIVRTG
jgi:hypothetical protein